MARSTFTCSRCQATTNGEKNALLDSGWQEMSPEGVEPFILCHDCVKAVFGNFPPPIPVTIEEEITKPIKINNRKKSNG